MRASELVDLKTRKLMAEQPTLRYDQALNHILSYDPALKVAYANNMDAQPTADVAQFAEVLNPLSPRVIDEMVARARQAHKDGTLSSLGGSLGELIREAWRRSSTEGLEIGEVLRRIIARGESDWAPHAAAELATGAPPAPVIPFTSATAGIRVVEQANKLAEQRLVEGKPELTFSGLVQEVLDADPDLKARYTGLEV